MKRLLTAAATAALLATSASAQSILAACAPDIERYCAAVEPGHGRLSACLYAHELVVSEECGAAIGERADLLDLFFSRILTVYEACGADAAAHCSDIEAGGGRVLACLREAGDTVSAGCRARIARIRLPGE